LGEKMHVGGGGAAGKIPAISDYPAQTKREQSNNSKEKHNAIKQPWPEARQ
jgi:hypothetical protein